MGIRFSYQVSVEFTGLNFEFWLCSICQTIGVLLFTLIFWWPSTDSETSRATLWFLIFWFPIFGVYRKFLFLVWKYNWLHAQISIIVLKSSNKICTNLFPELLFVSLFSLGFGLCRLYDAFPICQVKMYAHRNDITPSVQFVWPGSTKQFLEVGDMVFASAQVWGLMRIPISFCMFVCEFSNF